MHAKKHDEAWSRVHNSYASQKAKNFLRLSIFLFISLIILGIIIVSLVPFLWSIDINITGIISRAIPQSVSGPVFPSERVNMIILGKWWYENDAPDLTDSIIFMSYDNTKEPSETTATMVSIPRDLYITDDILGDMRINALYASLKARFGHEIAINKLMEKVSEIVGKPVNQYIVVDFKWFRDFVDRVDGITVDVPERLYDSAYPDSNWGYTSFLVEKWEQVFDGETALKYVRSRHSTSDFDRSRRQQIVIRSIKNKLVSEWYLKNPKKIENLFLSIKESIDTSMNMSQIIQVASWMHDFDSEYQLFTYNLNDTCVDSLSYCDPGGFLYSPDREITNGKAVLIPNGSYQGNLSNYDVIQKFIHLHLSYPRFAQQTREIHVFNATRTPGIAYTFAMKLKAYGFNVPDVGAVGNADLASVDKSFLYYDASLPSDDETLQALDFIIFWDQIPEILPQFATIGDSAIEIILGNDNAIFLRN